MQISNNKLMTVNMLKDVLDFRFLFILSTSVQLIVNYALLTTEQNGTYFEFKNFKHKKRKYQKRSFHDVEMHR